MALFDDSSSPRTERPTARRRRQARERGLVARSQELLHAARLLAIWLIVGAWFARFAVVAQSWLQTSLQHADASPQSTELLAQLREQLWSFLATTSWPLLATTSAVVMTHFLQVGWLWRWENVVPQSSRLSPFSGIRRVISSSTVGLVLCLSLKVALVVGVSAMALAPLFQSTDTNSVSQTAQPMARLAAGASQLASQVALLLVAFGLLDYACRRWYFERSLMMTRDELRDELKDADGDPRLKQLFHRRSMPDASAQRNESDFDSNSNSSTSELHANRVPRL